MIDFQEIKFKNPGVLIADIPKDLWTTISNSIATQIKEKDILKKLKSIHLGVGGISDSIRFNPPQEFLDFSRIFSEKYQDHYDLKKPKDVILDGAWINLQKKHEYRPLHFHEGSLSFVFWYKIPYLLENEDGEANTVNQKKAPKTNSRFQFVVDSYAGDRIYHTLDVDKSYEGKMILFNSKITHQVFPFFTSDDYRISVAGNFKLMT